ncbi:MAG: TauD/TfdA family dioxygenase [Pseudomonadales bacterium]|jgi:taurine dioxygenase|nr:TauD/TfdA family dioxygenase [Pseudomonadales bacterium]MDP5059989.1 TauD/TfdA family dioxygenase [Pseudomonadales bacterium]
MAGTLRITALTGTGAEVSGVDVRRLDQQQFDDIRQAFADYGLLFFRDQQLTETEHLALAERFGQVNVNRFFAAHAQYPQIALVGKEPDQVNNIGGGWHTDHSYDQAPALGSILVARQLPPSGGDTWFTSMYKAYEGLSAGLQQTLLGLRAVHSARHVFGSQGGYQQTEDATSRIKNPAAADGLVDPIHPVVITHPLSGKRALYVNPAFTLHFEGWTADESKPLLDYLYAAASQEAYITRFSWQPGAIAFWDNRATWHFAQNDYQGQARMMHRVTIEGCELAAG